MQLIEQSTSITIRIGPFLDDGDGKTVEDALTISQADIRLSKNGGDFAQSNDSGGATHDENGWYYLTLDATDTNTLGRLIVAIDESGALPVWREFMVTPSNVWDSLFGSDKLQVDVVEGSTALTEAYASDGAAATMTQLLYQIWSLLAEKAISGTTVTAKKLDGSTTSMTFTLNDSTNPTSITRAT